jgi:hypothetical protein
MAHTSFMHLNSSWFLAHKTTREDRRSLVDQASCAATGMRAIPAAEDGFLLIYSLPLEMVH